ncbi:MAG: HDOD domain-containing protein, partial [Phycisphaerales bacterium]|nr:HDOD domain-containing protein [Phycisphaerales bacterium]
RHGIGILALDYALPKTFGRVLQIASRSGRDLAEVERTVIGVDHHAAGRRLAERWGLPKALYDVIWLQGLAFDSLPDVPHKRTISIVNVAVAIARLLHLGWAGDPGAKGDPVALAMQAGLDPKVIPSVASRLHEAVSERSATIGMDEPTSESLLLGSIAQANRELDRIRSRITEREADTERHAWALSAVAAFQQAAAAKRAVPDVAAEIVRSSVSAFGAGCYALALRRKGQTGVELRRFGPDGRSLDAKMIEPPKDAPDVAQALSARDHNARLAELAPWLAEHPECKALGKPLKILSLGDGEPAAALLHDRDLDASRLPRAALRPLVQTWASALAFAAEAEQAQRTSQRAAEAERRLLEGQERIREAENLRRLAELATGAAEEMSKPLAVISGRCDLLSEQMEKQRDQRSLEAIRLAAERVGGLLNALKLFADPPPTNPLSADVGWLLGRAVREARRKFHADPRRYPQPKVRLVVDGELPKIWVDGEQVIEAVAEVVLNGLESEKSETIEVRAYAVPQDNRVVVLVMDDGEGMDSEALEHAFDPFFASAARGGRRQGLGLAKSRRLLGLNAGDIALRSKGGEGVIVAISLPLAPMEKVEQPAEKAA